MNDVLGPYEIIRVNRSSLAPIVEVVDIWGGAGTFNLTPGLEHYLEQLKSAKTKLFVKEGKPFDQITGGELSNGRRLTWKVLRAMLLGDEIGNSLPKLETVNDGFCWLE